jgi:hypothetical protein
MGVEPITFGSTILGRARPGVARRDPASNGWVACNHETGYGVSPGPRAGRQGGDPSGRMASGSDARAAPESDAADRTRPVGRAIAPTTSSLRRTRPRAPV